MNPASSATNSNLSALPNLASLQPVPANHLERIIAGLQALKAAGGDITAELQQLGLTVLPLLDKKVLVTGSARVSYPQSLEQRTLFGIGDAVAEAMVQNGASVLVNSFSDQMDADRLAVLKGQAVKGQTCDYLKGDMSSWDGAKQLIREAHAKLGGLDVLVLNAGTYVEQGFLGLTEADYDRTMDLNHKGVVAAIQEYVKIIGKEQPGKIIITSSINAQKGEPAHVAYDASKAALEASMRSIVLDLAQSGYTNILINAVAPGLIFTPLTYDAIVSNPAELLRLNAAIPHKIGWPHDLVHHYVHLASAGNPYMTGAVLDVSGGLATRQAT
mgnify:CR=1 FL=1